MSDKRHPFLLALGYVKEDEARKLFRKYQKGLDAQNIQMSYEEEGEQTWISFDSKYKLSFEGVMYKHVVLIKNDIDEYFLIDVENKKRFNYIRRIPEENGIVEIDESDIAIAYKNSGL